MSYTEDDFKVMQRIADDTCRKARDVIVEFLDPPHEYVGIDSFMTQLEQSGRLGERSNIQLALVLQAIDFVRPELLAWAKEGKQ
jgi:hypothetical protein